jgi:predicted nucleic acid-binding protein
VSNITAITTKQAAVGMNRPELFLDSSALFSGILSSQGGARALLLLAEDDKIQLVVSEQVIVEVERNVARKIPAVLSDAREMIRASRVHIVRSPTLGQVGSYKDWMKHTVDIPILVAAMTARVDFLVTLNTRHFLDDPQVSEMSGLRIGTPGDALTWLRNEWSK